jgi:hypothetical protein
MDTENLCLINKGLGLGKPLESRVAKVSSWWCLLGSLKVVVHITIVYQKRSQSIRISSIAQCGSVLFLKRLNKHSMVCTYT